MLPSGLLAEAATKPTGSLLDQPEFLWGAGGLAAALLAGAVAIYYVDKWRKKAAADDRDAATELTSFRALYERGEITEAEYNRLRQKLADRMKKPAAPATAAPGAAPELPGTATEPPQAAGPRPPVPGPFPPGYFDDPPPPQAPPPNPAGGTPPPA